MDAKFVKKAEELFKQNIKTDAIKFHCMEVEAIMKELAKEAGEDEDEWGITGLIHDLDFEENKSIETHAQKTVEMLKEEGFPEEIVHAVASHNEEGTKVSREKKIDYALAAADNVSGLIYAYGLMKKTLDGMEASGLRKRMKEKRFAANVNRQKISDIEKAGISLDKFLEVSIKAMQKISDKIGF